MKAKKKILFLSGTRADFGKLKPLIECVKESKSFDYAIFATGMHMLARYGSTVHEIYKSGFDQVFSFINQDASINSQMDMVLATTIQGFGHYVRELKPDLIVVHGDRVETLAGAIVGALNNVLVAHIEGGEVSGTVDELLRHSVTKLAHVHFVANEDARRRLVQMGESPDAVWVIGSPDIDVMLSANLPDIEDVKKKYAIPFDRYGIFLYHPVTTELAKLPERTRQVVAGLKATRFPWVAIYPNNDQGAPVIQHALDELAHDDKFRVVPSMRFEHFLSLLRDARCIAGNSSAGIREAPVYGVPSLNLGSRQNARYRHASIVDVEEDAEAIRRAMDALPERFAPSMHFGNGNSAGAFMRALRDPALWGTPRQKLFRDVEDVHSRPTTRPSTPSSDTWLKLASGGE